MTSNEQYWIGRTIARENEAYLRGLALTAKMYQQYDQAARQLRQAVNDFYTRYADKYGLTYERAIKKLNRREFQEWRAGLADYVKRIANEQDGHIKALLIAELDALSANSAISRLEALQGQIDLILNNLFHQGVTEMKAAFGEGFQESYYHKIYDMQARAGYLNEFVKLDEEMIANVISYPWSGAMFSDRLWQNKQALLFHTREIITQGIISGKSISMMSKELAAKMGQSYKVAERLIRTENAHFHNEADKTAYHAAGVKQYEFVATLEARTCSECGDLDGKHFLLVEAQAGVNYPPLHPNCRCTTIEYDPDDELDWRNSGKKMPRNMSYQEWREKQRVRYTKPITEKARMIETASDKVYNKGVVFDDKQFGRKIGKHAADFGLDPAADISRQKMKEIIDNIVKNRDQIVRGLWPGQGEKMPSGRHAAGIVDFIVKGKDIVIAQDGRFITILKDGITNKRFLRARKGGRR